MRLTRHKRQHSAIISSMNSIPERSLRVRSGDMTVSLAF